MIYKVSHIVRIQRGLFEKVLDREESIVDVGGCIVNMKIGPRLDLVNPILVSIVKFLKILK